MPSTVRPSSRSVLSLLPLLGLAACSSGEVRAGPEDASPDISQPRSADASDHASKADAAKRDVAPHAPDDASTDHASNGDATPGDVDATLLPDGAMLLPTSLPACSWPSTILPPVPDGDVPAGFVWRSYAYSTGCLPQNRMGSCCVVGAGSYCEQLMASCGSSAGPGTFGACVTACQTDQYVIAVSNWFGGPTAPPDADIVHPSIPSGCAQPPQSFLDVYNGIGSAEPFPTLYCCPCE